MKIQKIYSLLAIAIIVVIALYACREAEVNPARIQFGKEFEKVTEGKEVTLRITSDKAATVDMAVEMVIETNGVIGQHFTTNPAIVDGRMVLAIKRGQTEVSFKLIAFNNNSFDDGKYVLFSLTSLNAGTTKLTLIIEDDEAPVTASFHEAQGFIDERNSNGQMIEIVLSSPAPNPGKIYVINTNMLLQASYSTDQPISGGMIELTINEGDTKLGFRVVPIYDPLCQDKMLSFRMAAFYGGIKPGEAINYDLTVHDSDATEISFTETSALLNEDNIAGIDIQLSLVPSLKEDIMLAVYLSDNGRGNKYYTNPAYFFDPVDGGYITINIPKGATHASFKVTAENNLIKNDDYMVDFNLFLINGNCVRNSADNSYRLTIVDDE